MKKVKKENDVIVKEGLRDDFKSHQRHRGNSQRAAWWRPAACLAASRLIPKAGEPNQSQGKEGARAKRKQCHPRIDI